MDKVESLRGKPITAAHEAEWERDPELDLDPNIASYKFQLSNQLDKYTSGPAGLIVAQFGKEKVLEAWGQLADQGCSMREKNVHNLLIKAMDPRREVPDKEVLGAIAEWDLDIGTYRRAIGKDPIDPDQHKMLLKRMCSPELHKNLKMREPFITNIAELRQEIADWVFETLPRTKGKVGGRAAALGEKDFGSAAEEEVADEDWNEEDFDGMSRGQLLALVKNNKLKTQKGKRQGQRQG